MFIGIFILCRILRPNVIQGSVMFNIYCISARLWRIDPILGGFYNNCDLREHEPFLEERHLLVIRYEKLVFVHCIICPKISLTDTE